MTVEWVLRSLPADGETDSRRDPFLAGLTVALHQNDAVHRQRLIRVLGNEHPPEKAHGCQLQFVPDHLPEGCTPPASL